MNAPPGQEFETVVRQILRLTDMACDLDRNRADSNFAKNNGDIVYVFDENVFEMFIRPFRHRESVETFYADIWHGKGRAPESWKNFEAQAALIASEFLVSRVLNGAGADTLYMTEHHRWELAQRVDTLATALREKVLSDSEKFKQDLASKLSIIRGLLEAGDTTRVSAKSVDSALDADLKKLGLAGTPQSMLSRFEAARQAAAFLAEDRNTEPLDQLRRVVTAPIRHRLRSLQADFRPSPKEADAIEREADFWFRKLATELSMPGHRQRKRAQQLDLPQEDDRSDNTWGEGSRALMNDARSIAFMRWIINKERFSKQRILFITGDLVLFDAYRRWYANGGEMPGPAPTPGEPFFMRRITQYSPIFNPYDTKGDLQAPEARQASLLFDKIQQVVETSLIPFAPVFRSEPGSNIDTNVNAQRERLALKLSDTENLSEDDDVRSLINVLKFEWLDSRRTDLNAIRDLWQQTQRISIGASYNLVVSRTTDEQKLLIKSYTSAPTSEGAEILNKYVTGVLEQLLEESIQLWIPLAVSFATDEFKDPVFSRPTFQRISLALDFELIEKKCEGFASLGQYSPELLFAVATIKALRHQDINNAQRFAKLACTADELARKRGQNTGALEFELQYLNAVAHRMAIASVVSHLRPFSDDESRRSAATRAVTNIQGLYRQASQSLKACLMHHYPQVDAEGTDHDHHSVRYLRALSEQASLNLFMATSIGLRHKSFEDLVPQSFQYHLQAALGDLARCEKQDRQLEVSSPVLDAVRNQFVPNIACYDVLAMLLHGEDYSSGNWSRRSIQQIIKFWHESDVHLLLSAELNAWATMRGITPPRGKAMSPNRARREFSNLRLPLDRVLFKAIMREFE